MSKRMFCAVACLLVFSLMYLGSLVTLAFLNLPSHANILNLIGFGGLLAFNKWLARIANEEARQRAKNTKRLPR